MQDCRWVGERVRLRCRQIQPESGGKSVEVFCPMECRMGCTEVPTPSPTISQQPSPYRGPCENDNEYLFNGEVGKNCDGWVAESSKRRCRHIDRNTGIRVQEYCPDTCKGACQPTNAPTRQPTRKPTRKPSRRPSRKPSRRVRTSLYRVQIFG